MYSYAFCKYVHIAQTLLYTITLHVSLNICLQTVLLPPSRSISHLWLCTVTKKEGRLIHLNGGSTTITYVLPPPGFIRPLSITSMSPFIRPHVGKMHACNHFIGCIESYCCWCHGWKVNTLHVCFFIGCMHVRECIGSGMEELMWANYYVSWSKRSCL